MSVQQWFQKFWKGDESIEDEECSGWPPEVDNDQFRAISKLILLNYMRSCWRTQRRPFYSHQHLKQTGKVKNLDKGVPHVMSRPHQKKKIVILKCCLLLVYIATISHFSSGLWHGTKSGLYTITSNDQLSGWTEKRLQNQLAPKKRSWSLFGDLLLVWSTIALVKPLHLRSMLSKLMSCTKNCNTCSQHWPTKRSHSPPWQLPTACHTTNASKVERIGLRSFASSAILNWPLENRLHFLKHLDNFLQRKHFHSQQETENAFQEFVKHGFYTTGWNQLISHWQKCVDWNGSYFELINVFVLRFCWVFFWGGGRQ